MSSVLIDPIIIATPEPELNKQLVEKWFHGLNKWLEEATTSYYSWLYPKEAIISLINCNRFPFLDFFNEVFDKFDIDEDFQLTLTKLNDFLENDPNELKIQDVKQKLESLPLIFEVKLGSSQIYPVEFYNRWPSNDIQNKMIEIIVGICFYKITGENIVLASHPLPQISSNQLEIEAMVDTEPELTSPYILNQKLNHTLDLIFVPKDLPLYEKNESVIRALLLKTAEHIKASDYDNRKHVKGKTDSERQKNAISSDKKQGNGQFLIKFDDATIIKLEKEAIEKGVLIERENKDAYFLEHTFNYDIGYAAPDGELTKTIRVEWTSRKVHSHPILKN